MRLYLTLAWRNIWRNRRRSMISIASVLLAVVLALMTRSFQYGFYARSIDNVVSFYTGYIQVHAPGFWDKQSLNQSLDDSDSLISQIKQIPQVTVVTPRLSSYGLISTDSITDVGMVVGIDPSTENEMTGLKEKVVAGHYLYPDDNGIMLAKGMANHLRLNIGDTVVILGQGYHGVTAAGKYAVSGIVSFPTPEMNNSMAYLTLAEAQTLSSAYGRVTALVVMIDGQKNLAGVLSEMKTMFGGKYEIMTWEDMLPELVQAIETDNAGGLIMVCVIYMVIGFGILGTILMMTLERTREFGMLMAVGMKRTYLSLVTVLESVMLTFSGVIIGVMVGIPVMYYFHIHPIRLTGAAAEATLSYGFEPVMPTSLDPMIVVWQAITILIIALIADMYPLWRIHRLDSVTAMRKG